MLKSEEVVYRHSGVVRATHWINVVALLVLLMSGLQIFNAHPALYLGSKSTFDDPVMAMQPMRHGERGVRRHYHRRLAVRHDRRVRPRQGTGRQSQDQGLSLVGDAAGPSRPRHRAALAFLLRLGLRHQRDRLFHLEPLKRASPARPRARASGSSSMSAHRSGSIFRLALSQRRRGEALQRASEARLSRRGAGAAAAHAADRACHVARHGRRLSRSCSTCSAAGSRRGPSISSLRASSSCSWWCTRHGADHRRLEQSSLHDHRPLRDQVSEGRVMSAKEKLDRRGFLTRGLAVAGAALLGGCEGELSEQPWVKRILELGRDADPRHPDGRSSRQMHSRASIARPTSRTTSRPTARPVSTMTPIARTPRTASPIGSSGSAASSSSRSSSRLRSSAPCLRARRSRGTIAWRVGAASANGPACRSKPLLDKAGLKPAARYIVLLLRRRSRRDRRRRRQILRIRRARGRVPSADHPRLRDERSGALPIPHGAPLRLRVERQLGYKMAKYVMRIEAVEDFAGIRGGRGGFWEDRGYEWYAGI